MAIFGATGGIGSELARRLVKSGHRLGLIARSEERLEVLAEETGALSRQADVTVSAAATYAGKGIRVNRVAPGIVRTLLTARITQSEAALRATQGMHPLRRIGEPGDVAAAMEFRLSPASGWITGQILGIDGGLATLRVPGGRS